jgi:thiol-disulfide isomerase/thioredoxin
MERTDPRTWLLTGVALALAGVLLTVPASAQTTAAQVVSEVRAAIDARDLDRADAVFTKHRRERGETPEVIEALSWLGRGALAQGQLDRADRYAREAYQLAVRSLGTRSVDTEPRLATAVGAAIEVQAQVYGQRNQRSDAVSFLRGQLATYKNTSIHTRIQKNINLLSLEGQRAPAIDRTEFIGPQPPTLDALKGKVVLLFFWAHWCPDCKAQAPIISSLLDEYRAQGFTVIAPTQRFGYAAGGVTAGPAAELRYIQQVRDTSYKFLVDLPVPVSESTYTAYGVSTTPTLVLVDRSGIVRMYHPGQLTKAALEQALRPLLAASSANVKR